jgi:hypothetical protein
MSANPLEIFTAYAGTAYAPEAQTPFPSERRQRSRIRVHWPVLLFRQGGEAVMSTTQDLSSSGFFCVTAVAFVVGEVLTCALKVPSHDPNGKHLERNLECRVRVVRVQAEGSDRFGLGCRIEDYHLAHRIQPNP